MSGGVYTTWIDVLGGAGTVDEWGYPVEEDTVVLAGIPAHITETRQTVATESDPQAVAVHYYTGRIPAGITITDANRVKDTRSGIIYQVDYVNVPNAVGTPGDIRLDLRRVT
jgi:hypothetical protein